MKKMNLTVLATLLLTGSAVAQQSDTSGNMANGSMGGTMSNPAMSSGKMSTQKLSTVDRAFLKKNAQGSVYDLATSETALQKASSPAIQQYATTLIQDHARLNAKLLMMANRRKITLPITLDTEGKTRLTRLSGPNGTAFDRAYLKEAIRINSEDVRDAQKELSVTKDPQVRALVSEYLQTEQKHLSRAQQLSTSMGMKTANR